MALTAEQRNNIKRALGVARGMHAPPRVIKALVEAMGVESNYQDLDYGDRDSVGILQQRPSQGWGPASESLETDVSQFVQRAMAANRTHKGSAGSLAQAVQRSAFPDRYDQRSGEANRILRGLGVRGQDGGGGAPVGTSQESPTSAGGNVPDLTTARRQLLLGYVHNRHNPDALLQLAQGLNTLKSLQGSYGDMAPGHSDGGQHTARGGGGHQKFDSSDLYELFYNGPGGVNADEGHRVGKGFVEGHTDHVHVAAPTKDLLKLAKKATKMGLSVREFEPYDKVDPVHATNSFHYKNQAMDVSGDPRLMRRFDRKVARRFGV